MKMKLIMTIFTAMVIAISASASAAITSSSNKELQATYRDIQNTLGIVPTFMKNYPEEGISAAWEEFKSVELSKQTLLSGKLKELIGLAVAAQTPCKYCVYFHTEVAKMNGATETEIKEAISMAAATRHWSTFINGSQYDMAQFQKEADAIMTFIKKEKEKPVITQVSEQATMAETAATPVTDAKTAYADIERTLGSVPNFFKIFPENSISGAWKMMKSVQLNPETQLMAKEKEIIGLAVAAQVPCNYCTYFHTAAAKLNGSNTDEIHEALAMASMTRFWSTVLNGTQMDEAKFKREVGQIIRYVKSQNKRVGMISPK